MTSSPVPEGLVHSLTRRLDAIPHPLTLFARLADRGRLAHSLLLESAEPAGGQTQRSMLVISSTVSFICRGNRVSISALNSNGISLLPFLRSGLRSFLDGERADGFDVVFPAANPQGSDVERLHAPSPTTALRTVIQHLKSDRAHGTESVFLSGVFAYDFVGQFESLPEIPREQGDPASDFPDYYFVLADRIVSIDHMRQRAEVVANVFGGKNAESNYFSAQHAIGQIANVALETSLELPSVECSATRFDITTNRVCTDRDDVAFVQVVEAMKRHIVAGDVFQIVPSRVFSLPCRDPLNAYASLRRLNPSPYLFYVNFPEFVLFGASPESAVKVDGKTRTVEISPIAGTRPRGFGEDGSIDAELDARIEAELRLDEKENAEHMMLVDLARNDVARVSRPGTRRVADLARVDRYSHVMHLVSRVRGVLRDDLDALHAYQASMNMGTLSGAPKIKAMQLIRQYEGKRRGHYGGAVGYLRGDGSLDTAIIIRSALVQRGIAYVRAGAGVVHDSIPQLEADETRRKAEAVLRAIAVANRLAEGADRHD